MERLAPHERDVVARLDAAAMLARVHAWVPVNSGTRNLAGVARMAALLADAFAILPGDLRLVRAAPVDSVTSDGRVEPLAATASSDMAPGDVFVIETPGGGGFGRVE